MIDDLTDLDALRALAKGMQTYQARLERRNKELAEENARLRGEVSPEQLELLSARREEELARLRKQVFGTSSGRRTTPVQEAPTVKDTAAAAADPRGPPPEPLRLIPGGRYSIEFGIAVVLGKREEHPSSGLSDPGAALLPQELLRGPAG